MEDVLNLVVDKIRSRGRVMSSSYGVGEFCESYWKITRLIVSWREVNIIFFTLINVIER